MITFPTLAKDGRPSLSEIYAIWKRAIPSTWKCEEISYQELHVSPAEILKLPIYAFYNSSAVDYILIGGIHGREPAGALALTLDIERVISLSKDKKILILPLLNPWGYQNHVRKYYKKYIRNAMDPQVNR